MSSTLRGDTRDLAKLLINEFEHPATYFWRTCETALIREFMRRHALASPILDLGCAEGTIARALFGAGDTVIGLDNCWELLSSTKRTEPYRSRLLGDGCCLPFKKESFGSVFSNCVIEHIPALESVLAEAGRVLKPGGSFMFTVPSARFPDYLFFSVIAACLGCRGLARAYAKKRNALLNHFHCYGSGAWKEKLARAGLKYVDSVEYMSRPMLMLWDALAAYFYVVGRIPCVGRLQMRGCNALLEACVLKGPASSSGSGGALLVVASKG